jgi:hypothetical protein
LVMTPRSFTSHWVQCELSYALEMKKPIFPLLLEGERWFSVSAIQVVDVKNGEIPPDRFFQTVSASIVNLNVATADNFTSYKPVEIVSKTPVEEVTRWKYLDVENELDALRRKLAEVEIQQTKSVGDHYADLGRYLKNGQWKEADEETYRLMITEVGKEAGQWFDPEDLRNFPCEPLRAIDGLWVEHSGGKFGFSVQKKIYVSKECGGIPDGRYHKEAWDKFCHTVGWQENGRYVDVIFDTASPSGHLPAFIEVEALSLLKGYLYPSLLSHPDL